MKVWLISFRDILLHYEVSSDFLMNRDPIKLILSFALVSRLKLIDGTSANFLFFSNKAWLESESRFPKGFMYLYY